MRTLPLLSALFLLTATAASAAEAPRDLVGRWLLGGVSEGDESCGVTLTGDQTIGGWAVVSATDCEKKVPASADLYAWNRQADGSITFHDATRRTVLTFTPVEIGGYGADGPDGQRLSLDRPNDGPPPTEQERMSGRWALMSMGDTFCAWTSTADKAGMKGTLVQQSPCQPAWASKKIVGWQRIRGGLILVDAAGKTVRSLPGDSIEGFFSPQSSDEMLGFVRDWGN